MILAVLGKGATGTTVFWVHFGDSACEMPCFVKFVASSRYIGFKSDVRCFGIHF